MTDLPTRLEGAAAGSRELDDSVILAAFGGEMMDWWDDAAQQHQIKAKDGSRVNVTPVTTSIDAAVALAERVLPGCYWLLGKGRNRPDEPLYGVQIMKGEAVNFVDAQDVSAETEAATPALALCAAIIRARAEQKEG